MTDDPLVEVLTLAQRQGLVGPGPVARQLSRSELFLSWVPDGAVSIADLGSGGGLPGLVIGVRRPLSAVTLVDRSRRACDFLERSVGRLGIAARVEVVCSDLERWCGRSEVAGAHDVVTMRGVGPVSGVLARAVAVVRPGGLVMISEPPALAPQAGRWDEAVLAGLGVRRVSQPGDPVAVFHVEPGE